MAGRSWLTALLAGVLVDFLILAPIYNHLSILGALVKQNEKTKNLFLTFGTLRWRLAGYS
jgi:hypothetical protein